MEAAERLTTEQLRSEGAPSTSGSQTQLEDAAEQFEALILRMLLAEMRKTISEGGLFENKQTQGYQALLDDALTKKAAEAGTFGLANQLVRQMEQRS